MVFYIWVMYREERAIYLFNYIALSLNKKICTSWTDNRTSFKSCAFQETNSIAIKIWPSLGTYYLNTSPPNCVIKWTNKKNNFYKQRTPGVYEAMRCLEMIPYHGVSIIPSRTIAIIDSLINVLMSDCVYANPIWSKPSAGKVSRYSFLAAVRGHLPLILSNTFQKREAKYFNIIRHLARSLQRRRNRTLRRNHLVDMCSRRWPFLERSK